uniref:Cyclin-dependent kinases regulatory subunit n=1 Tax=Panagrellus redivivus TaxID=6233 RepID=A0A7E4ZU71_PANRE
MVWNVNFNYSKPVSDATYKYREVQIPLNVAARIPPNRLLSEREWHGIGIRQKPKWEHFMVRGEDRDVLVFRCRLPMNRRLLNCCIGKSALEFS